MAGGLPPHLYLDELKSRNQHLLPDMLTEKMYRRITEIERNCRSSGVMPIYTLGHLAKYCGINYYLLDTLSTSIESNYTTHLVKRRSKGKPARKISSPSDLLKMVQGTILRNALPPKASPYSFAYTSGLSARKAVQQHVGANVLISLDIKEFFDQCKSANVQKLFRSFGYSDLLSTQFTSLTTRGMNLTKLHPRRPTIDPTYIHQVGYLPQGAPTSGMISNLLLSEFDESVIDLIIPHGGVYTRYADDMQLSFSIDLNFNEIKKIIFSVKNLLLQDGFRLNESKSRVQRNHGSLSMLGFSIQGNDIRLNNRYRSRVSCLMRAVDKYGIESFVDLHPGIMEETLVASVEGHYVYISGNDAEFADEIRHVYHSIMKKNRPLVGL